MSIYLDTIQSPSDLRKIPLEELPVVCHEIRSYILNTVAQLGGHLAPNLGAIELTVALHYVLNSPEDKIVWDVGHQVYTHKILTGRKNKFFTLKQKDGLSGFPNPQESEHDLFSVGHASTSIPQALGLAVARDRQNQNYKVVAVAGDGSLTGGLAYEGLNNAGQMKKNMFVILNDNEMSISKNVGAISQYLNNVITNPIYNRVRSQVESSLDRVPRLKRLFKSWEEAVKGSLVPAGIVFEELGFRYFGPVDGHDVIVLVKQFEKLFEMEDPCLIHVITKKGKGYAKAEENPEKYHSCGKIEVETGEPIFKKPSLTKEPEKISYTKAFSRSLIRLAEQDERVVAITAAMPEGTGLDDFKRRFPERFYDVGIAEQFAVTFAGGLSKGGLKPVCAIYATFLQRAYDQLIHDVALQRLNLTVAIDRAGCVGPDGAAHQGLYDCHYLRGIPGTVVGAPKDEAELYQMLKLANKWPGVFAIRYPKDNIPALFNQEYSVFAVGEGELVQEGEDIVIASLGYMSGVALEVADRLKNNGISAAVLNLRFVKPLDENLIKKWIKPNTRVYVIEDHLFTGGLGSALTEFFERQKIDQVALNRFAFPDQFIEQGSRKEIFEKYGLTSENISQKIVADLKLCKKLV